jgi:hypothetical protein
MKLMKIILKLSSKYDNSSSPHLISTTCSTKNFHRNRKWTAEDYANNTRKLKHKNSATYKFEKLTVSASPTGFVEQPLSMNKTIENNPAGNTGTIIQSVQNVTENEMIQ